MEAVRQEDSMKYAKNISEIPNAFTPRPLGKADLKQFYCGDTMEVRTGDPYDSPIEDIYDAFHVPSERNAFLMLGHHGCGKSTELNEMSARLAGEGFQVRTIECAADLDLINPGYPDLLLLMGDALLDIAEQIGCRPDKKAEETIREFWIDVERERSVSHSAGAEAEAGVKTERGLLEIPLLKLFANLKLDLKYNEETRTTYREQIQKRVSGWLGAMNTIADQIAEKLDGRQPVIIFEDLDKLGAEEAWKVFYGNSEKLTGVSFPLIYTFPIALSYDHRFGSLEGYFQTTIFPMMKLTQTDDSPYEAGLRTIREIVEKRADLSLFDEAVLDRLIRMTGGSLRDLFRAINTAATRTRRRHDTVIRDEDAERALEAQKSLLTRRMERRHYSFLRDIMNGSRENIEDRGMLLEMLQAGVVLEYNGRRWHNVHPLAAEFLKSQD